MQRDCGQDWVRSLRAPEGATEQTPVTSPQYQVRNSQPAACWAKEAGRSMPTDRESPRCVTDRPTPPFRTAPTTRPRVAAKYSKVTLTIEVVGGRHSQPTINKPELLLRSYPSSTGGWIPDRASLPQWY